MWDSLKSTLFRAWQVYLVHNIIEKSLQTSVLLCPVFFCLEFSYSCKSCVWFLVAMTNDVCYFTVSTVFVCLSPRNNMNCIARWAPRFSCVKYVLKMTRMWRSNRAAIWCARPVSLRGRWGLASCSSLWVKLVALLQKQYIVFSTVPFPSGVDRR